MTTKQCLIEARALIADKKHWTQGTLARAKNSVAVNPNSDNACRYCAVGAVQHSCESDRTRVTAKRLLDEAATELFSPYPRDLARKSIISVNDRGDRKTAHKRVLRVFDRAIEKLK